MNVMKQRDKSTMVVSLYFDQQRLLLLLLLLCGGTHLLAESHVGDLKAGDGADTDVEDGEEENADNTTHEDSYERMSAQDSIR
jgi:tRNA A37 N6-isopentenylltransferase MiaA